MIALFGVCPRSIRPGLPEWNCGKRAGKLHQVADVIKIAESGFQEADERRMG
jgi:hypothetical protein